MQNIVVFGDSHSRYFEVTEKLRFHAPWLRGKKIEVYKIPASSIIGLGKQRSKLNVSRKVESEIKHDDFNVFAFGQVDLELGFYYKKIVKNDPLSLDEFVLNLLSVYEEFVLDLGLKKENIALKGLNLTVLKYPEFACAYIRRIILENVNDPEEVKILSSKLKETLESFSARNNATLLFNNGLKNICKKNGWKYFDLNDYLSDFTPGKGILDRFIPASFDHHIIDSLEVRKLHLSKLIGLL